MTSSRAHLEHEPNGVGEPSPLLCFCGELLATGFGELVVLGPAIVVGSTPMGADPAAALEPMQAGIERALRHLEGRPRHLPDALRNRPAVSRGEGQRLQDEKVEGALGQIEPLVVHYISLCASTRRLP